MKKKEPYKEILKLSKYCEKIGVKHTLEPFYDGYSILFGEKWDIVQHRFSYGSSRGCVEPAIGCRSDYSAVSLDSAKKLVKRYKERLNGVAQNG